MERKITQVILILGITISMAGGSQNSVGASEIAETNQNALMVSSTFASQKDDGVAGETEIRNGITYTLHTGTENGVEYKEYMVSDCEVSVVNAEILGSVESLNVTSIATTAFDDCTNLVSVSVPDTVTRGLVYNLFYPQCNFKNCRNLNRIEVSTNNSTYCSIDGVVYSKDKTQLLYYPIGKYGSYSIPDGTTCIGEYAFYLCSEITDVTCPNSVTKIGACAFKDSSLRSINISGGVNGIQSYTFQGCTKLKKISLPNTVEYIQGYSFENCTSLNNLTIPGSLIWGIGQAAFKDCTSLTNVTIQDGVRSIAAGAFWNCRIKSIYIPASVTSLGSFFSCNDLCEINVDENNPNYRTIDGVLYDKEMTTLIQCPMAKDLNSFVVQNEIKNVSNSAFAGCSKIEHIVLPDNLESIGKSAFAGTGIMEITIPKKISKLQEESKEGRFITFLGAKNLKKINVVEDNQYFASYEGCLYSKDMQTLICCPEGKERVKIYKETKEVFWMAFSDCDNLQVVNIPESVEVIGPEAFRSCDSLKNVIIPNSRTSIHDSLVYSIKCFDDSPNVIICCNPGSCAEQYAKDNGLKYGPIPEHVHSYESEVTKEPTCMEKGVKTYSCQECDSNYTEEIPLVAHVFEIVTDSNGIVKEKCRVCGKIKSTTIPSSGSTESTETEETEGKQNVINVTSIKITALSAKLAAGKKVKLSASVFPINATNKKLKWSSSNKKYATVDQTGRVTLKSAGAGRKVTITAIARDGSNKKATYKITIMKHAVKSVKIKASAKTVKAGKSLQLKAVVKTTGTKANKDMVWSSSNKKYATVNKKGTVKTKKAGKGKSVTITVQSTDGTNKKATIKIKIK